MDGETLKLALIPLIAGVIGYWTNFVAVKMLFYPVHFVGFKVPGLHLLTAYLPRKLRAIPGVATGGVGWQGIIPSRAAKMGSISVDKGIAKLGSPSEFYDKLDPNAIADHIVATSGDEIWSITEQILEREHPGMWADMPDALKRAVRDRMEANLPNLARQVTNEIGENIDDLMDIKLMVIRRIEEQPELANRIFLEVGQKEMDFIVKSGFYFGFLLGLPQIAVFALIDAWYVLPIGGILVGYLTNSIALKVIFLPVEPRQVGPFTVQGLFLKRQKEVAGVYSKIIADDIVNLRNISDELMRGRQSDRTRRLIAEALRPAIDKAVGIVRPAVRVAMGTREYDRIRDSLASEGIDATMAPLADADFNEIQSAKVRNLLEERMETMPPDDFSEMLRTAVVEDEWMLILLGAVLGFLAGWAQVAFVF